MGYSVKDLLVVFKPKVGSVLLEGAKDPSAPATKYKCVCTTSTVQYKAEVPSKSRRKKLFSDMS